MSNSFQAKEIASFYIQLLNSIPDNSIDNLKLNKILYYAQAWSLTKRGKPIFSDEIIAWDYGPVIPEVYHMYKCCGSNAIVEAEAPFDEGRLSGEELELLIDVYRNYGKYTGWALKDMTHKKGAPWSQVYKKDQNNVISHDSMMEYYSNKILETFDPDSLSIPVVTSIPDSWDSEEDSVYD